MDESSKQELVRDAKGLGKFFELKVELKLFGQLVWSWTFPPKSIKS